MRRLPILATLIVLAACGVMVALGLWQLDRARWKEDLIQLYKANAGMPEIRWTRAGPNDPELLFRKAQGTCSLPVTWSARAGRNLAGEAGWSHVGECASGLRADLGWSRTATSPRDYAGGPIRGTLGQDTGGRLLIVADRAAPGLEPTAAPSLAGIPNSHRGYAFQWFTFAGIALLIYGLALWKRARERAPQ